jgi:hypothetical protein
MNEEDKNDQAQDSTPTPEESVTEKTEDTHTEESTISQQPGATQEGADPAPGLEDTASDTPAQQEQNESS